MTTQDTEAGMLASQLRDEAQEWFHLHGVNATSALCEQSAAELDRLVAIKDELVRALEGIVNANDASVKIALDASLSPEKRERMIDESDNYTIRAYDRARAALASARSQEKTNG